jgi:hypothetical protein
VVGPLAVAGSICPAVGHLAAPRCPWALPQRAGSPVATGSKVIFTPAPVCFV